MPTPIPNIWQLQSKNDVDGLILAIHHPDAGVRRGAAAALRAIGAWQAVPALEAALTTEHDWQVHAAISAALQYLDRDIHIETMIKNRDVRGLSRMLSSSKLEDLIAACNALGEIGDRQGSEPLVMVFRNALLPNKARLAAAEALLKLESAPAVVTLLGALRRGDNWQVRRNAAAVLGQLQAGWATEPLIKALQDENTLVRKTAAAALRRIGTPEALHAAIAFEAEQRRVEAQEAGAEATAATETSRRGTGPLVARPGTGPLTPRPATGPLPARPQTGKLPPLPEAKSATGPLTMPQPATPPTAATSPATPTITPEPKPAEPTPTPAAPLPVIAPSTPVSQPTDTPTSKATATHAAVSPAESTQSADVTLPHPPSTPAQPDSTPAPVSQEQSAVQPSQNGRKDKSVE